MDTKIEKMQVKIEKMRAKDNYVLLYCKGEKGTEKLMKICDKNKLNFWPVSKCSRNDNAKFNNLWNKLHEYTN